MFDLVDLPIFKPSLNNQVEIRFLNPVEEVRYVPESTYYHEVKTKPCPICEYFNKRNIIDTSKHKIEISEVKTAKGTNYYERRLKNIHNIEIKRSPLQLPYELTRNKYVI